jgi:hypothetical protein
MKVSKSGAILPSTSRVLNLGELVHAHDLDLEVDPDRLRHLAHEPSRLDVLRRLGAHEQVEGQLVAALGPNATLAGLPAGRVEHLGGLGDVERIVLGRLRVERLVVLGQQPVALEGGAARGDLVDAPAVDRVGDRLAHGAVLHGRVELRIRAVLLAAEVEGELREGRRRRADGLDVLGLAEPCEGRVLGLGDDVDLAERERSLDRVVGPVLDPLDLVELRLLAAEVAVAGHADDAPAVPRGDHTYGFSGSSKTRPSGSAWKARWNHAFVSSVSSSLRRVKRVKFGP